LLHDAGNLELIAVVFVFVGVAVQPYFLQRGGQLQLLQLYSRFQALNGAVIAVYRIQPGHQGVVDKVAIVGIAQPQSPGFPCLASAVVSLPGAVLQCRLHAQNARAVVAQAVFERLSP
jgi:hypothetical protein